MALEPASHKAKHIVKKLGLTEQLSLLERAWETEMGGWSRMARVVALDNFSLVVEADSSAALQELHLRRKELLRKINSYFSETYIKDITLKVTQHG